MVKKERKKCCTIYQRWAFRKSYAISKSANLRIKKFVIFADLPQMWHCHRFAMCGSNLFVNCDCGMSPRICGIAICGLRKTAYLGGKMLDTYPDLHMKWN
jgi:hypothetical protein